MPRVIIAGYGLVGRALADSLFECGISVTIIDTDVEIVRIHERLGHEAILGDASDPEVLRAAGVASAEAIAVTLSDEAVAVEVCRVARSLAPGIFIAVRTRHVSHAVRALRIGADSAAIEEVVAAESIRSAIAAQVAGQRQRVAEGAD